MLPKALTIAGSDSGGGAGIQADLKTFMAHGVYGTSVLTAVTAQNTLGVHALEVLRPALVEAQLEAVLSDIGADAVKTGMLGSAEIVEVVAALLARHRIARLVVDPVLVATSGRRLLAPEALAALRALLLPRALLLTPNLPEAEALLGRPVADERAMAGAVRDLHALGPRYVLLKGGHLPGDPVDLLYDGREVVELRSSRVQTRHSHGTGCTYAAAIAAQLARGLDVGAAVRQARSYLVVALERALDIGAGAGSLGH